jgi:hypothetical protein
MPSSTPPNEVPSTAATPPGANDLLVTEEIIESSWRARLAAYRCILHRLQPIDDRAVQKFYPLGNEPNRERAQEMLEGGNLLMTSTLAMEYCLCTNKQRNFPVFLFKVVCRSLTTTTSDDNNNAIRNEVKANRVLLCFDATTTPSKVLGYPFSSCGCEEGATFCSHLLVTLLAFQLVQRVGCPERFEEIWPEPPTEN